MINLDMLPLLLENRELKVLPNFPVSYKQFFLNGSLNKYTKSRRTKGYSA